VRRRRRRRPQDRAPASPGRTPPRSVPSATPGRQRSGQHRHTAPPASQHDLGVGQVGRDSRQFPSLSSRSRRRRRRRGRRTSRARSASSRRRPRPISASCRRQLPRPVVVSQPDADRPSKRSRTSNDAALGLPAREASAIHREDGPTRQLGTRVGLRITEKVYEPLDAGRDLTGPEQSASLYIAKLHGQGLPVPGCPPHGYTVPCKCVAQRREVTLTTDDDFRCFVRWPI